MYSLPSISVSNADKGLGFDWGGLIENITKAGTNIYQQIQAVRLAKIRSSNPVTIPVGQVPTYTFYSPMASSISQPMSQPVSQSVSQSGFGVGTFFIIGSVALIGMLIVMKSKKD